jgi:hypothetical protein
MPYRNAGRPHLVLAVGTVSLTPQVLRSRANKDALTPIAAGNREHHQ